MNALPLFCDVALAKRIEHVEVELMAAAARAACLRREDGTGFVTPVADGVATFADDGSPFNKIAGLGFGGVPDAAELDAVERAFAERGAPVQAEVSQLADPAVGEHFPRQALANAEREFTKAGVVHYIARCDGSVAGGGSLRMAAEVAQRVLWVRRCGARRSS